MAVSTGQKVLYDHYSSVMETILDFRRTTGLDSDTGTTQRDRVLPHNPIRMGSQNYKVLADTINELATAANDTTAVTNTGCPTYNAAYDTSHLVSNNEAHYDPYYATHLNTNRNPHYSTNKAGNYAYNTSYLTGNRNPYYSNRCGGNHSYNWNYKSSDNSYDTSYDSGWHDGEDWFHSYRNSG